MLIDVCICFMNFRKVKFFFLFLVIFSVSFNVMGIANADGDSPNFVQISDKEVKEGEELVFTIIVNDSDSNDLVFTFGNNPGSTYHPLPNGNTATLRKISASNEREFHWTPELGWEGVYEVRFSVNDGDNSDHENVLIEVTGGNHAPVMDELEDIFVIFGDEVLFTLPVTHVDLHDDLEYEAYLLVGVGTPTRTSLPHGAVFEGAGKFSWIPDSGEIDEGDYDFRFCVNDQSDKYDCEDMTITVGESYPVEEEEEDEVDEDVIEDGEVVDEEVEDIEIDEDGEDEDIASDDASEEDEDSADDVLNAIIFVEDKGVFVGDGDTGEFAEDRLINRAEVAKVVVKFFEKDLQTAPLDSDFGFLDLIIGEWYMDYIYTAFELGVMTGNEDGGMAPGDIVNRAEIFRIFLETAGVELESCSEAPYLDVPANEWFCKYAEFAKVNNLIEESDYFYPEGGITRGDTAELFYQYHQIFGL